MPTQTPAQSANAVRALGFISELQKRYVKGLNEICASDKTFLAMEWLRDDGKHGGGARFMATDAEVFNRASINISQVHYDDDPSRKLGSATAISAISHPAHPLWPSMHMHISWTEMKNTAGYFRLMADLNPAIPNDRDTQLFKNAIQEAGSDHTSLAEQQGDRYFHIPSLDRHRGVYHFYLEQFTTPSLDEDFKYAQNFGEKTIDAYCEILKRAQAQHLPLSEEDSKKQLEYHSVYLLQVLTLDRGTTSGLLIHDQNDTGILGSLPSHVSKPLLQSWVNKQPKPQDELLTGLIRCLPEGDVCLVDDAVKLKFASYIRDHYKKFPQALDMQASGNSVPPTVDNHK